SKGFGSGGPHMDRAASSPQGSTQGDSSAQRRPHPYSQPKPATESGATLTAGQALGQTGRHFFPELNDRAQSRQLSLPVHDTLDHFLGHVALSGWERLRLRMVQRLLRMKALDAARLL